MGELEQVPNHQVKVDNWPLFFLQRLHHFYRKKSHCDLTLLFSTLDTIKSIKVHKLVLHACTDYFESLDIMKDSEHGEFLQLSNEMQPDVVIPIISFMYTGKLEFPVSLQPRLYEAATKLRMTILTKLLDVQPNKTGRKSGSQPAGEPSMKLSQINTEVSIPKLAKNNQDVDELGTLSILPSSSSKPEDESVVTLMPVSVLGSQNTKSGLALVDAGEVNKNNQIKSKVIKKNVGLQLAPANAKTKLVVVSLPPTLPGRKLPVWKRKVPLSGSHFFSENMQNVRPTFRPAEKPRPTRFEWEDDLNDPTTLKPVEEAFKVLSHDGSIKISHPIILEPDGTVVNREASDDSMKRSSDGSSFDSPPHKRSKQSDLQDMKEYGKQQQLRNEIICSEENTDDMMDTDDLYGTCDDEPDENFSIANVNSSTPKPILKTVSKPEPTSVSKRVRFSLEGKENNRDESTSGDFTLNAVTRTTSTATATVTVTTASPTTTTTTTTIASTVIKQSEAIPKQKIVLPMNMSQLQSGKHHVKIVSEVLKKYPNLAKRENIKLRVVSKNPAAVPPTVQQAVEGDAGNGNKANSSLVSYIFLTNKGTGELLPIKTEANEKDKVFDVENKTGPWFCHVCDESPIEFESYYAYRRHLVEVHELKIDARICEYCGLKNSKRNHLLYHLYTKHGIDPPAHVSFPKCSECDYIALSDALLVKHKSTHDPKSLTCYTCNVVFKSYSSMQIHLQSAWHKNKVNDVSVIVLSDYPCPFCEARFENGAKLKDHIETDHHSQREGKQIYRCPYCEALFGDGDKLGKHIVSLHWGKNSQVTPEEDGTNKRMQLPQSEQEMQFTEESEKSDSVDCHENRPSTELESLSNVASGIATSLSLVGNEQTVVYYEQRSEGQDVGGEATVVSGNDCKEYIIAETREDLEPKHCATEQPEDIEIITVENEDSNSRTSNTDELNKANRSDHDYTEAQTEDQFRNLIPVHPVVGNQLTPENAIIQQIIPATDQRLVFSTQANVVFQSPCVSLPPRVLFTSGKVGDQNVILSQVISQTPIILSSPMMQQTGSIVDGGNGTLVLANPAESGANLQNIQTTMQQYSLQPSAGTVITKNEMIAEKQQKEEEEVEVEYKKEVKSEPKSTGNVADEVEEDEVEEEEETEDEEDEIEDEDDLEEVEEIDDVEVTGTDTTETVSEVPEAEEIKQENDSRMIDAVNMTAGQVKEPSSRQGEEGEEKLEIKAEPVGDESHSKGQIRLETSKIVDDWDETNEGLQNVESRKDGPSRPDFF
ncbi:hypothetical protein RUM44_005860 [Polyplax serrata]|uniref:Centrosome-associated zinc finger protein CP190 n=1 Tax=Polyplax serrata TaxID=468196 RepID=A0ABR1AYC9_POLSC